MSHFIRVSCIFLGLAVLWIIPSAPDAGEARSMHPNELWTLRGGQQQFENRCCDQIDNCEAIELCSDTMDPEACPAFGKEEENPPLSNTSGCNFAEVENTCTEDTETNICKLTWSCQWNAFAQACEKFQAISSVNAPRSCTSPGC